MNILFFDTETIGLPADYDAPYTDIKSWPRMLQIAWIVESRGNIIREHSYIVYPDDFTVPERVAKINRISQNRAESEGIHLPIILDEFELDCRFVDKVVAHNYNFDYSVLGAECVRLNRGFPLEKMNILDMMLTTVNFCKLPGKYHYKWPKLQELYICLFGEKFEGAHDALVDIKVMSKCYWELERVAELKLIDGKNQYVKKELAK